MNWMPSMVVVVIRCGAVYSRIIQGRGWMVNPPPADQIARAAARRSRLRIAVGTMNQRSRLPLSLRVASRMPAFSRSTITAWMVPLWRRGSMPMARTRSLQVIGPSLIRRVRIAVRMMEVSIGCGAFALELYRVGGKGSTLPVGVSTPTRSAVRQRRCRRCPSGQRCRTPAGTHSCCRGGRQHTGRHHR